MQGLSHGTQFTRAIYILDKSPCCARPGLDVSGFVVSADATAQFSRAPALYCHQLQNSGSCRLHFR